MNIAYAQTAKNVAAGGFEFSVLDAMAQASWPVQVTFLILVLMSVASWAIIFTKKKSLDSVRAANAPFLDLFWRANSLEDIFAHIDKHQNSSIARVFRTAYIELRKLADSNLAENTKNGADSPMLSGIDNLERSLRKAIDTELTLLESRMSFLATTGSTGPFIGLFGTVWGIMGAFHKIGATNMANLAVVAPGISEALVATAVGLAAAIPATVAYNHFLNKIKKEELDLNSFAADFLNITKRNFFKDR
jgi:biopolymer transport protein TolQ